MTIDTGNLREAQKWNIKNFFDIFSTPLAFTYRYISTLEIHFSVFIARKNEKFFKFISEWSEKKVGERNMKCCVSLYFWVEKKVSCSLIYVIRRIFRFSCYDMCGAEEWVSFHVLKKFCVCFCSHSIHSSSRWAIIEIKTDNFFIPPRHTITHKHNKREWTLKVTQFLVWRQTNSVIEWRIGNRINKN